MGLLQRLLGGSGCRFSHRTGRGRIRALRQRSAGHHEHVESCAECRARQQRERQYLERLRGAAVPEASDDLTARLLARTGQLAAERADTPAADPEPGDAYSAQRVPAGHVGAHSALPPALAAGGAVAVLALMAGTAYLMGSDAGVPADGTTAAALEQSRTAGPLVAEEQPTAGNPSALSEASSGTRIGLGMGGEPDFTPAGALSTGQLAAFRSQGWACPELRELGFHLVWARAGAISGDEVLELRLTDGQHFATVLEQHASGEQASSQRTPRSPSAPGGVPERAANYPPINVLTGHTAAADGFTAAQPGAPTTAAADAANGVLWVNATPPFRAIYQTAGATYTYVSDLPAEQADDAVPALARAGDATPASASRDGIAERMERGLSRILERLAP